MRKINKPYEERQYFAMALDPIHIGTGGYRLGRVDNTIVREPDTKIPKIPGTTIEGCARTYAYYQEEINDGDINEACAVGKKIKVNGEEKEPKDNCSICTTFGFTKEDKSLHGMAQFSDARILFFPVHSMIGPVWVTSSSIVGEFQDEQEIEELKKKLSPPENSSEGKRKEKAWLCDNLRGYIPQGKINLGWLYLEAIDNSIIDSDELKYQENGNERKIKDIPKVREIIQRLVVVSDALFSQIVNSNLEVRTSVSINPETGAAQEGALFTYEAIPRGTLMHFDITFLNPENFPSIPEELRNMENIKETARKGLKLFKTLGVGGMGTRGFGRLTVLNLKEGDSIDTGSS